MKDFTGCLAFLVIVAAVVFGIAIPVYYLWNWLMPQMFGLPEITYWMALGLIALITLLFNFVGGWRK